MASRSLSPGRYDCAECDAPIIVSYHRSKSRPDPIYLDAEPMPHGAWRLFAKKQAPDFWLCEYAGRDASESEYCNHRVVCPNVRVESANGNGSHTEV